jgi:hypothetical protein
MTIITTSFSWPGRAGRFGGRGRGGPADLGGEDHCVRSRSALSYFSPGGLTARITDQSDTQLTVAIPSYFAVPTDVTVCTVMGCSEPDPSIDGLTYASPGRPTLSSSSPKSGRRAAPMVTLNGTLDSNVAAVHFGSRDVQPAVRTSGHASADGHGQAALSGQAP